jgi:hypothetical protein
MASYGTVAGGDTYFASRLHVEEWSRSTTAQKTAGLAEATARIDRLRFGGYKVSDTQTEEFPRYYGDEPDGTETVPNDIIIACYEIAFSLLDGVNPDLEQENLAVSARGVSSARTTYARQEAPEHFAAGIPSAYAWRYLKPYISDSRAVIIRRVS